MKKEEALQIIKQALNVAALKGAFTIDDMNAILNALKILDEQ